MTYDFEDANYWFDWAEKMRNGADLMREPGIKLIMLSLAHDYEQLGYRAHHPPKRKRKAWQYETDGSRSREIVQPAAL